MNTSGNVLFLILLAIALFAALSYAVTNSSRSSLNNSTSEKDELLASDVIQYGATMAAGIQRIRIINNVEDTGLDFHYERTPIAHVDSNVRNSKCTNVNCDVFNPANGLVYRQFSYDPNLTGAVSAAARTVFYSVTVLGVGDDTKPELVLWIGLLPKAVCAKINEKLGIDPALISNNVSVNKGSAHYVGNIGASGFPASGSTLGASSTAPLFGQRAFCGMHSYWGGQFFQVLWER